MLCVLSPRGGEVTELIEGSEDVEPLLALRRWVNSELISPLASIEARNVLLPKDGRGLGGGRPSTSSPYAPSAFGMCRLWNGMMGGCSARSLPFLDDGEAAGDSVTFAESSSRR